MHNQPEFERICGELAKTAQEILNGQRSWIEGSRRIQRLWNEARLPERDPDYLKFVGINSETDAFPLGDARRFWSAERLERLQTKMEVTERRAAEFGRSACRNIVERFRPKSQ